MSVKSYLEEKGKVSRAEHIVRNDFSNNDAYSASHDMAKTHDDENHPLGKGTDSGGHTTSVPHQYSSTTLIVPQIDTNNGGGSYDKYGRNGVGGRFYSENINIYNRENQYSKDAVEIDTLIDGQYFIR